MKLLLQSACCLFAAFTAFADIVKMTPLDTFVDGTNAVLAAANAYTDAHSGGVDTNAVRDIAREEIAPAATSATNYTDACCSTLAVSIASNAANIATNTAAISTNAANIATKQDRLPFATNAIPSSAIADAPWYVNGGGQSDFGDAIYSRGMYSAGNINILTGTLVLEDMTRPLFSEGGLSVLGFTFYGGNRMYTAGDLKVDGPYDPDTGTEHPDYYIDVPKRYNGGLFSFVLNDDLAAAEQNAAAYTDAATNGLESAAHAAATYQPKGNYLTSESDPTVPSWAKQTSKPAYTYSEIGGAFPGITAHQSLAPATNYTDAAVSSVTSAVPVKLPAATIAAFNAALATNGIATLSADATLYDALDRLMQMASRSTPGPVPPEVDPVVVRLDGVVEYYEIGSGADVETVFVYGGLTGEFAVITNPAAVTADILVVGGGGGGGAECSGGGGGGHVVAVTNAALVAASYAIQVGAGGNYQGGGWSGNSAAGANGGNSSLVGGEIALAAQGGGGGGGATKAASYYTGLLNGGGLGCNNQSPSAAPVRSGGRGNNNSGGGGASDDGVGYDAAHETTPSWGREGVTSDITGVAQVYGSGGGGGRSEGKPSEVAATDPGKGGANAGHGCYNDSRDGCNAAPGFGGGGGGGSVVGTGRNGGNGGSGTVIIRVKGKCTVLPEESAAPEGEEAAQ